MRKRYLFATCTSILLLTPYVVWASNATWSLNANGNWNVNANWTPTTFPNGIDSIANFIDVITASRTITLGQDITIGTINVNDNNNFLIVGANSLIFDVSTGNAAIAITNTNGNGAHRIESAVTLNRNLNVSSTSTATFRFTGVISGAGGLNWAGTNTGDLLVSGVNTYSGPTNINNGTFTYSTNGCIPSGNITTVGTGSSSNSPTLVIATSMTNPIVLTINSDGTLTQNNNDTVQLTSLDGSGQINLSIATGNTNLFEINGTAGSTFSGTISGGAANASTNPTTNNRVYKDGTSILTLSGNSDFISRIFIANGAISAQSNNCLGVSGVNSAVYVRGTGTSGSLYLQNNIMLPKTVFINGPGYVSGGAIQNTSGSNTITGDVRVGWSGGPETASDATIQASAGNLTLSGILSGANNLSKTGSGTLTYSGNNANTLSGMTTINGGTLQLNKAASTNALAANVQVNSSGTLSALAANQIINTATVTLAGGTFNLNGNVQTIGKLIFNSGTLTQGGALLTLASAATALSMRNTTITGNLALTGGGSVIFDNAANGTATISGNIDLGGSSTVFNIADGTATIDMLISGIISNGGLNKLGAGTQVLTGANNYAGGTTVSAGTLQGNTTSLQGNIVDNANLVFDQTFSGTYAGSISGLGTLVKQNSGTVTLSNSNSVAGISSVTGGGLIVNGTLAGGNSLTTSAGTVLGGTGTITKDATIRGILAPGNSIGTIHLVGTETLASGSILQIELNPTTSDLVDVVGSMSIQSNATLQVLLLSGSYSSSFSNTYTIIQTTTGVTGTFSSVQKPSLLLQANVVYRPLDVLLQISFSPLGPLFPGNAGQVAQCLDKMSGSDIDTVIEKLLFLPTLSDVQNALEQMQPSAFTSLAIAQENNTFYIQNAITNRLEDRVRSCYPSKKYIFWASPLVGLTYQQDRSSEPGFTATSPGVFFGFDAPLSKNNYLGCGLGYTYTDLTWKHKRGDAQLQSVYTSFYGRCGGKKGYFQGMIIGAYNAYSTKRNIEFSDFKRSASGNHGGGEGAIDIKGGGIFQLHQTRLSPFLELNYIYLHESSFTEHGANSLDLIINSKNSDLLTPELGLEVVHCFPTVSFFLQASAIGERRFMGKHEEATFACRCCSMNVRGLYPSRILGSVALGFHARPRPLDFVSFFYKGKYGSHFQDHSAYFQIAY